MRRSQGPNGNARQKMPSGQSKRDNSGRGQKLQVRRRKTKRGGGLERFDRDCSMKKEKCRYHQIGEPRQRKGGRNGRKRWKRNWGPRRWGEGPGSIWSRWSPKPYRKSV